MSSPQVWKEKNLSGKICQECAAASVKETFRPAPGEQKAADTRLDERYPERKKEEARESLPLFDVPMVQ